MEQELIGIKLKYAESEEIKERLVTKLEGFMIKGNFNEFEVNLI